MSAGGCYYFVEATFVLKININEDNIGILESYNDNNISKFSRIIFENYNKANSQEKEDDVGFKFLHFPVNKKYLQILDIRVQAKKY